MAYVSGSRFDFTLVARGGSRRQMWGQTGRSPVFPSPQRCEETGVRPVCPQVSPRFPDWIAGPAHTFTPPTIFVEKA
jgi:hypothetical protein